MTYVRTLLVVCTHVRSYLQSGPLGRRTSDCTMQGRCTTHAQGTTSTCTIPTLRRWAAQPRGHRRGNSSAHGSCVCGTHVSLERISSVFGPARYGMPGHHRRVGGARVFVHVFVACRLRLSLVAPKRKLDGKACKFAMLSDILEKVCRAGAAEPSSYKDLRDGQHRRPPLSPARHRDFRLTGGLLGSVN